MGVAKRNFVQSVVEADDSHQLNLDMYVFINHSYKNYFKCRIIEKLGVMAWVN